MSKTTALTAAVVLLALALVIALVTRPATQAPPRPAATAMLAAPADNALAKDSTDPAITGFIANFRQSSAAACQNSLTAALKTSDPDVEGKADAICGCASDTTVASLTVGEVHAATLSAVAGDAATNPTLQSLKTRFAEATQQCMLDRQKN